MTDAEFLQPAARSDPIGQHADEQCLAVGAARDKCAQAVVLADMIAIVMQMLPIFLQARPTHGIDDGERTVLALRNGIADGDIVEKKFVAS